MKFLNKDNLKIGFTWHSLSAAFYNFSIHYMMSTL